MAIESLQGKTALVTGAALRLGRAVAVELAARGAAVVVHYRRSRQPAEELVRLLEERGGRAWALRADLNDPAEAERLVGLALERAGRLDLLVNSASIFPADTLRAMTAESLAENVRVNAYSPLVLARRFAEAREREAEESPGRPPAAVVNLLDTRITDYDREHAAYHAGKLLLFAFTRMLSLELAPRVRVNAVAPGLILPPPGRDRRWLEGLASTNPLSAVGGPEDVRRGGPVPALQLLRHRPGDLRGRRPAPARQRVRAVR